MGRIKRGPKARLKGSCSFCGKPQERVTRLIAGPGVYICNECIDLCLEISTVEHRDGRMMPNCSFCGKSEMAADVVSFHYDSSSNYTKCSF